MPLVGQLLEDRLGDVVVATPVGGPFGVGELVHVVAAGLGGQPPRLVVHPARASPRSGTGRRRRSISSIFSCEVERGITAMNGRPSIRAKYASDTAVEPDDASMIVVPSQIQPLHSA